MINFNYNWAKIRKNHPLKIKKSVPNRTQPAHPFILKDFDEFEESFEVENKEFEEDLIDAYITSIKTNHNLNNGLVDILNIVKFSFIIFFVALILILVIL